MNIEEQIKIVKNMLLHAETQLLDYEALAIETLLTAYEEKCKELKKEIQDDLDVRNRWGLTLQELEKEKEKNKNAIDFINERKKTVNKDMAEGTRLQVGTFMWQVDELLEILKGVGEE